MYYGLGGGEDVKRYDVCARAQVPVFGSAGFPCDELRVLPDGQVAVTCDSHGGLLGTSGTQAVYFASPNDPAYINGRFAALGAEGKSFWMGTSAGVVARYDVVSGQRVDRWTAGPGLGGIAVYNPPPAPPTTTSPGTPTTQSTSGNDTIDATAITGGLVFSSAPSLDMPALAVAHGRLLTSGGSLRLDTGLQVTCPATGPRCSANVTLTVADAAARAAAASVTRVGTLSAKIAPGAKGRLVVRLNKKGAALVRKRSAVTIAARVSIRAAHGPAVVRGTSVRVLLHRSG
jgi:hypothetical protein